MHSLFRIVLVGAALIAAVPAVAQQITSGTVTGVTKDEQGLVLPGATIELRSEETGTSRQSVSNEAGVFNFPGTSAGRYSMKVSLQGFRTSERSGIQLRTGEIYDAGSVVMVVGQFTEVTTVSADLAIVQTGSAERTSVLEAAQLDSLIVRGRDPMSLLNLLPGVTPVTNVSALGGQIGPVTPSIGGQLGIAAGLALDGQAASDGDTGRMGSHTSVDAIEEVRVVLNNYQAEYGRNTGAQINVISKSGTNEFHGSLATYIRHEALTANNFFNERNGLEKPLYRYKTLSGTLGGPLMLPGVSRRDRTFFFYSREMWDADEPRGARRATMPTALERAGDFSQTLDVSGRVIPVIDPLTGQPFPGNRIPANRINANGQAILNLFPEPNFFDRSVSGGNYNYNDQDVATLGRTLDQLKVDHTLSDREKLSVRWRRWRPITEAYSGVFAVNSNWNHFRNGYAQQEDSVLVNHTRTLGGAIVNEASMSFRYTAEVGPILDSITPMTRSARGLSGLSVLYPGVNNGDIIPQATFAGVPGTAPSLAYDQRFPMDAADKRWVIADNVSWAKGRHLVKAGVYWESNLNSEGLGGNCFSGCFNFSSADRNNPGNTGHAFANALLGNFATYSESSRRPLLSGVTNFTEWFVQDSWKARSNLSLDLGVRFSYGGPFRLRDGEPGAGFVLDRFDAARRPRLFTPTIIGGQRVGFDAPTGQTVPVTLIGALVPESGDFYNGLVAGDDPLSYGGSWRKTPGIQPQPRVGFSWDPRGDMQTAVRGGFGITKQVLNDSGDFSFQVTAAPPSRLQPEIYYGNIATLGSSQGFFFPGNVPGFQPDYDPMTTYNFSLEVQHNVGLGTVVSAAYVGNRQSNIVRLRNLNVLAPGARFNPANIDPTNNLALPDAFLRPMVGLGDVILRENTGSADYDSLQLTANRRYIRGFSAAATYTFSRTRDDSGTVPMYQDPHEYLYDYSTQDRRHLASVSMTWDLPSTPWNNVASRAILNNWQIAAVGLFASGGPAAVTFTTVDNADITGGGDPGRINMNCDPNDFKHTFDKWFDTSCFSRPARGDFGNAPRQMIRLPGSQVWDLTFSKNFPMGRAAQRLQFRAELYNAFNLNTWTSLDTVARFDAQGNQINPTFGQVNQAGEPRVVQLSLRWMF